MAQERVKLQKKSKTFIKLSKFKSNEFVFTSQPPNVGQITVNKNIDRELLEWLNFTVVATDSGNPSLSTSIPINVQVLDVNDNNPVFNQSEYVTTVTENTGSGTFVIITPATDKDVGQYGSITYKLTGGDGFFTIDSTTVSFFVLNL